MGPLLKAQRVVLVPRRLCFDAEGPTTLIPPRAVAVDVVGGARETRAVAADDRFEGLVEAAVVSVGGIEALARRREPGNSMLQLRPTTPQDYPE
jgi:hypothetical protein